MMITINTFSNLLFYNDGKSGKIGPYLIGPYLIGLTPYLICQAIRPALAPAQTGGGRGGL